MNKQKEFSRRRAEPGYCPRHRLRCTGAHGDVGGVCTRRIVVAVQIGLHMGGGPVQLQRCAAMSELNPRTLRTAHGPGSLTEEKNRLNM